MWFLCGTILEVEMKKLISLALVLVLAPSLLLAVESRTGGGPFNGVKSDGAGGLTVTGSVTIGSAWHGAGSGSPEGAVTAIVGSTYTRLNGGAGTTLYIKEAGTGNTGWVAVVSGDVTGATINDSAGDGNTTEAWSANKIFDSLALKQNAVLPTQESTTTGILGKTANDQITMGNAAGAATLYFGPVDDTVGNGNGYKTWSADKIFDSLAGKQATLTGAESLTFTNKTINYAGTGNDITVPISGLEESILDPADADDFVWRKLQFATTITDIHCIASGGGSITLTLQECDSAGANCANIDGAITCDGDGAEDDGSLTDGSADVGDWIKVLFSAPTGTVDSLSWKVYGTQVW
jgi:hypothetical protein